MIITDIEKLKIKCEDVLPEEISDLRSKLQEELILSEKRGHPGLGLAAPQIGIYKRMAIIRIPGIEDIDLVNIKSIKGYDEFLFKGEGCLSFPGKSLNCRRYNEIYISDNMVYPYKFIATGLLAVAIQHEQDHLDGILFTERSQ